VSTHGETCICGLHPAVIATVMDLEVYVYPSCPPEVLYVVGADVKSQDLRDVDLPGLPDE
jgi:hypothetical protein